MTRAEFIFKAVERMMLMASIHDAGAIVEAATAMADALERARAAPWIDWAAK